MSPNGDLTNFKEHIEMQLLRSAIFAIGLMGLAGACGGGAKSAEEPAPAAEETMGEENPCAAGEENPCAAAEGDEAMGDEAMGEENPCAAAEENPCGEGEW